MDFSDLFSGEGLIPSGWVAKVLAIVGFLIGAAFGALVGYYIGLGREGFANLDVIYAIGGGLVGGFVGALGAVLYGGYIIAFLFAALAFFAVIGWNWMTGSL